MYTVQINRNINVPQHIAWDIISDLEQYADYAPNLSWAKVISGQGEGLVRRCADTNGGEWNETCVFWDEGNIYSIQVDTSDYPYPFTFVQGTWSVKETHKGTDLTMKFDIQLKQDPPLIGWCVFNFMMRPAFARIGEQLMDNWEGAMFRQVSNSAVLA